MHAQHPPLHTRFSPVFVLGCTGSGTSLACRLLLDHLGVNFGTESQFIIRYARQVARYGDLRFQANMRRLLTDISRERFFPRTRRNFGFVLDIDRALRYVSEPSYAGALRAIFGSKTAYEAAKHWCDVLALIRGFAARIAPEQFLEFRYEDLLEHPARTLDRVASFLGVTNHACLMAAIAAHLRVQVRSGNSNKWHALESRELECIEAVAGPEMADYARTSHRCCRAGW